MPPESKEEAKAVEVLEHYDLLLKLLDDKIRKLNCEIALKRVQLMEDRWRPKKQAQPQIGQMVPITDWRMLPHDQIFDKVFLWVVILSMGIAVYLTWLRTEQLEGARDNAISRIEQLESRVALPEKE